MVGGRPQRGGRPGRFGPAGAPQLRRSSTGPTVTAQERSAHKKVVRIEGSVLLQTLAARMGVKATEMLMKLLGLGMIGVNINSSLDADTAKIVANEFGWEVEDTAVSEEQALEAAQGVTPPQAPPPGTRRRRWSPPCRRMIATSPSGRSAWPIGWASAVAGPAAADWSEPAWATTARPGTTAPPVVRRSAAVPVAQ
jgi:hypothetical protein